jgi:hypothetical protein
VVISVFTVNRRSSRVTSKPPPRSCSFYRFLPVTAVEEKYKIRNYLLSQPIMSIEACSLIVFWPIQDGFQHCICEMRAADNLAQTTHCLYENGPCEASNAYSGVFWAELKLNRLHDAPGFGFTFSNSAYKSWREKMHLRFEAHGPPSCWLAGR